MNMLDLIIIGGGHAGITASIYAARKKMNFVLITGDIGGQASYGAQVEDYTGFQMIRGADVMLIFEKHLRKYGVDVREGEKATQLKKSY